MPGSNQYNTYNQLFDSHNYSSDNLTTPTTPTTPVTGEFTYEPKDYVRKHSQKTIYDALEIAKKKKRKKYWDEVGRLTDEEDANFLAHMNDRINAVKKYNKHLSSKLNPPKPTTKSMNGNPAGQTGGNPAEGGVTNQGNENNLQGNTTPDPPVQQGDYKFIPAARPLYLELVDNQNDRTIDQTYQNSLSEADQKLLNKARTVFDFVTLDEVKQFQQDNGLTVDGDFGGKNSQSRKIAALIQKAIPYGLYTIPQIKAWQTAHGLTADGDFGSNSIAKWNEIYSTIYPDLGKVTTKQKGGRINMQEQIKQLVQAAAQGNKEASAQIQQIVNAAQNGDPQAQQILQLIQQEIQAMQMAKRGAKLNYLKSLKGDCAEGEEVVYFKKGGNICKKCEKVDKHQTGGLLPALGKVLAPAVAGSLSASSLPAIIKAARTGAAGAAPLASSNYITNKQMLTKRNFAKMAGPLMVGPAAAAGAAGAASLLNDGAFFGGKLPEVNVTADAPVYDGGTLPEVTIDGQNNFDDASFGDNATLKSLQLSKKINKGKDTLKNKLNK